jgi:hypothetical protein
MFEMEFLSTPARLRCRRTRQPPSVSWRVSLLRRAILFRRAVLLASVLAVVGRAADGQPMPPERLLQQLDSGSLATRDRAERDLIALGPTVLPMVARARQTATAEAGFRLDGILQRLERLAAERAVEPTMVSFSVENLSCRDALATLFNQTGSRIELGPSVATGEAGESRISVSFERATFWEAMTAVLDTAGLSLEHDTDPPGLRIVPAAAAVTPDAVLGRIGTAALPAVAAGPLRVAVAGIEPVGPPVEPGESRPRGARVILRVTWEPRLEPLLIRLPMRSLVAEGPAGEAMPPAQRASVVEALVPTSRQWLDLPALLAAPAHPLESLGMLRGTMVVWLAGMEHTFLFQPFQFKGVSQSAARPALDAAYPALDAAYPALDAARHSKSGRLRVAQAEVRLLDVAYQEGQVLVRASVTYDAPSEALASHHTWLQSRKIEVFHADGRPLKQVDQRVETRSDQGMTAAATFALPPAASGGQAEALQIRWRLPIAIHEVPIDFALRNLPLPTGR